MHASSKTYNVCLFLLNFIDFTFCTVSRKRICAVQLHRRCALYVVVQCKRFNNSSFVQQSKAYKSLLFLKLEAGVLPFGLNLLAPFIKLYTVGRIVVRNFIIHISVYVQLCIHKDAYIQFPYLFVICSSF